ncbi:MAG: molecular chaperone [Dehalococcoidia bacterium]|nr:molecular chaperone [Dehalococcoidia bacterium]MSQ16600.1 molecular chaperone [Dehalococcoidia bacterium]
MLPKGKILPLALVGAGITAIVIFVSAVVVISWFSNPPFGLGNAPPQPIAFPHTVHAGPVAQGGMGIQCEFCHRNVTKGAAATVPAVEQCLFCHKTATGGAGTPQAAEIAKIQSSFDANTPIDWERVHRLPDHVRFVHEAHVRFFTQGTTLETQLPVGEVCSKCHGDVASMTEVQPKQGQSLKMGTCLDCHRQNSVPTDCTICHQ